MPARELVASEGIVHVDSPRRENLHTLEAPRLRGAHEAGTLLSTSTLDLGRKWLMRRAGLLAATLALVLTPIQRAQAPAAIAQVKPPNLVIVLTDDQRWDTAQPPFMPRLTRLVSPSGITYTNGFVPNPLCCPSRASTLTGDYSQTTGVWNNGTEDPDAGIFGGFKGFTSRGNAKRTIAVDLHAAGYRTGLVGKYLNGYPAREPSDHAGHFRYVPPGWDEWFSIATGAYYDYYAAENGARTPVFGERPWDYSSRVLTKRAVSFVRSDDSVPFFLYLAYTAPHTPATADPRDVDKLGLLWPNGQPASYGEADVSDKPDYVQLQAAKWPKHGSGGQARVDDVHVRMENATLGVDRGIGRLWKALPDDTYVLFASDNGFLWGEHDRLGKMVPYDESIRVPLTLAYKGPGDPLSAGSTDDRIVLNVDYLPTLESLAGVTPGHPVEGQDFLTQTRTELEVGSDGGVTSKVPAWCGVRSLEWDYARYGTGEEELYDEQADPFELQNLASDPLYAAQLDAMRADATTKCTGGTYYPPDFPTFP
jgi:N-acetylglucosamine-6-sulfatase